MTVCQLRPLLHAWVCKIAYFLLIMYATQVCQTKRICSLKKFDTSVKLLYQTCFKYATTLQNMTHTKKKSEKVTRNSHIGYGVC